MRNNCQLGGRIPKRRLASVHKLLFCVWLRDVIGFAPRQAMTINQTAARRIVIGAIALSLIVTLLSCNEDEITPAQARFTISRHGVQTVISDWLREKRKRDSFEAILSFWKPGWAASERSRDLAPAPTRGEAVVRCERNAVMLGFPGAVGWWRNDCGRPLCANFLLCKSRLVNISHETLILSLGRFVTPKGALQPAECNAGATREGP